LDGIDYEQCKVIVERIGIVARMNEHVANVTIEKRFLSSIGIAPVIIGICANSDAFGRVSWLIAMGCTQNNIWSDERSSTRMRGRTPPRIGVDTDVVREAALGGTSPVDDARRWDDVEIWAKDGFILIVQCPFEGGGLWLVLDEYSGGLSGSGFRIGLGGMIIIIDGPRATKIAR